MHTQLCTSNHRAHSERKPAGRVKTSFLEVPNPSICSTYISTHTITQNVTGKNQTIIYTLQCPPLHTHSRNTFMHMYTNTHVVSHKHIYTHTHTYINMTYTHMRARTHARTHTLTITHKAAVKIFNLILTNAYATGEQTSRYLHTCTDQKT